MKRQLRLLIAIFLFAIPAMAQQTGGTIRGHVRVTGDAPGNPMIRMGADPMCSGINGGKRPVQEIVMADEKGNLGNVFVRLEGEFPKTPIPTKPAVLDQRGCLYAPRVIGMRVGQTLQIHNDDPLSHNVHIVSKGADGFTITMPIKGSTSAYVPKAEEVMLHVGCDFHRWMTAYIGVVNNPYYAVSGDKGTFEIKNVPPGTYTVQAWHEIFGPVTKKVTVTEGGVTNLDFSYSGKAATEHSGRL